MITTRFLASFEYPLYADWLKKLDKETRTTYFGIQYTDEQIDNLVKRIIENSDKHHLDRKSTRLNSSHIPLSRMPSSA